MRLCSGLCHFHFDCSTPDGAVLVLPNGASRRDLSSGFRPLLLEHARNHALSWLESVYGRLDLAKSIYLITGCDKCDSWCLASYSNVAAQIGVSLSFTPTAHRPDGAVRYEAQSSGSISKRTFLPFGRNRGNQCVFIRGYKISACRTLQERLWRGPVDISDVVSGNTDNSMTGALDGVRGWAVFSWFRSRLSHLSGNGGTRSNILDQEIVNPPAVQIESFPGPSKVTVPSTPPRSLPTPSLKGVTPIRYHQFSLVA
jgi:hypothetical protein